jgi:hypothetical protein
VAVCTQIRIRGSARWRSGRRGRCAAERRRCRIWCGRCSGRFRDLLFEFRQAFGAGEGLVVAEKHANDARLDLGEPLVGSAEIFGAGAVTTSSPAAERLRKVRLCWGNFCVMSVSRWLWCCMRSARVLPTMRDAFVGVEGDGGVQGRGRRGAAGGRRESHRKGRVTGRRRRRLLRLEWRIWWRLVFWARGEGACRLRGGSLPRA